MQIEKYLEYIQDGVASGLFGRLPQFGSLEQELSNEEADEQQDKKLSWTITKPKVIKNE